MEERMGAEGYGCAGRAGQEPGTGNLRKEFWTGAFREGRQAAFSEHVILPELIEEFCRELAAEERSPATIEKYRWDVKALLRFLGDTGEEETGWKRKEAGESRDSRKSGQRQGTGRSGKRARAGA